MKHKGIKPPAQPRSLRSIAERNKGEFPADVEVDEPLAEDPAEAAKPGPGAVSKPPAAPTPCGKLGGK
jgi:hypothetical protein